MRNRKKFATVAIGAAMAVAVGATASSCDSVTGGFKDLEGVAAEDPTDVRLYNNVDGYPNIVTLCTQGVAWATTTREGYAALQRVEDLDRTCTASSTIALDREEQE